MALEIDLKHTPIGFSSPAILRNAYVRIDSINGTKNKLFMTVGFYNKANDLMIVAYQNLYEFYPNVNDDSQNFIKQGYEHLKTLPEFAVAIDC
jgi:hypothetical protein